MSRLLSDLLGAREPAFSQHIASLEQASGSPGVDLRLASDISAKVRQKLRELGLDPADTTGEELYQGLQNLVDKHDEFLAKKLGIKAEASAQAVIAGVIKAVKKLPIPQTVWVLKHSSVKKLLSQNPPKHVMKLLHYRSIDSLLKRADLDETFAAIYAIESASWRNRFVASYKKLTPSDFENRKISVLELSQSKWGEISKKFIKANHHNVIEVNELGVIAVLPISGGAAPGLTITLLPQIIYRINKLRSISSYLKLNQVKPDFTSYFIKAIAGQLEQTVELHGENISWDTLHKFYGRDNAAHPEVFMPHIQPEDLRWKRAEDVLYKLEPALKFWENLDYVAAPFKNNSVPLGLLDNSISYTNQLDYGEHSTGYFKEALIREIYTRYLDQPSLEDTVMKQFDEGFVEVDMFAVIERGMR